MIAGLYNFTGGAVQAILVTSFFLSSNVEREEAFGGAAAVDEQREGTACVFPACLCCHVHAWNGQTKQKSG